VNKNIETTVVVETKYFATEMVTVDGKYAGLIARSGPTGVFAWMAERAEKAWNDRPTGHSTREEAICSIAYPAFYR